jgi:hypothetical protein
MAEATVKKAPAPMPKIEKPEVLVIPSDVKPEATARINYILKCAYPAPQKRSDDIVPFEKVLKAFKILGIAETKLQKCLNGNKENCSTVR